MDGVKQRVSLITLGVADLGRARAFYEALGWETGARARATTSSSSRPARWSLALWDRARLAEDSGVEDGGGWGGVTLALNFGSARGGRRGDRGGARRRRDDRPRARRDLLGRLQRRLRRPRRPPLGDRPQPALDGHRGRRRPAWLSRGAGRAHLNLVESSRLLFELDPGAEIEAGERLALRRRQRRQPDDHQRRLPRSTTGSSRPSCSPGRGSSSAAAAAASPLWARGGVAEDARADLGRRSGRLQERLRDAGDDPRRAGRGAPARRRGRAAPADAAEDAERVLADRGGGLRRRRLPARGLRLLRGPRASSPRPGGEALAFLADLDGAPVAIAMTIVNHGDRRDLLGRQPRGGSRQGDRPGGDARRRRTPASTSAPTSPRCRPRRWASRSTGRWATRRSTTTACCSPPRPRPDRRSALGLEHVHPHDQAILEPPAVDHPRVGDQLARAGVVDDLVDVDVDAAVLPRTRSPRARPGSRSPRTGGSSRPRPRRGR